MVLTYHNRYMAEMEMVAKAPNPFKEREKAALIASQKKHQQTCAKRHKQRHNRNKKK